MRPASAAAARTAAAPLQPALEERLRELLERSAQAESLAGRLLPAPSHAGGRRLPAREGFYWLEIARRLAASFRLGTGAGSRTLLDELEWIQYLVYGIFRVQDDLVDGDADDARLVVGANHLLVEAARSAARAFAGDSPFWSVFRGTVDATSRAIVELDRLQRSPERPPGAELALYEEQAACLKIAAAGVAIAGGREGDWRRRISPALDRLAVAAQIVDDLRDLSDDLARGRINYAAWFLSRPVFAATPEAIEAVVASNLATGERLGRLLGAARELLGEAAALVPPTLCPGTHAYLRDYGDGLGSLGEQLARGRRRLFRGSREAASAGPARGSLTT